MKWFGRLNKPLPAGSNKVMNKASAYFMKNTKWVGLVTALAFPLLSGYGQTPEAAVPGAPGQAQAAAPVNLSPGAAEVVRLAGSGVGDDVVVAYIQNSQAPFNLSADAVLYLKDIGLSPQVTSAMLSHDGTLRNQPQQYAPAAPAAPAPAVPPGNAPLTYQWQTPPAPVAPAPAVPSAPVTAPPPAYVTSAPADVSYFYNDLSPYGTWVSLEGYGWCWQPRTVVISRGWRPYCDGGHWVYTDAGWFWQSDYSWGWAPFHYGRWYSHPRCGWVWMPDRVWGPAWVTWRVAGDSCGWAPLPPRAEFDVRLGWRFNGVSVGASFDFGLGIGAFAFVGFGDFCSHDLGHRCLPPARVTTIYRQTTVINNYVVVNNTIVHRGIPIERVTAASRVPVPRATVRDLPAGSAQNAQPDGVGGLSAAAPGAGTTGAHGGPESGYAASGHSARPHCADENATPCHLQPQRIGPHRCPTPAGNGSAQSLALVERRQTRILSAIPADSKDLPARAGARNTQGLFAIPANPENLSACASNRSACGFLPVEQRQACLFSAVAANRENLPAGTSRVFRPGGFPDSRPVEARNPHRTGLPW